METSLKRTRRLEVAVEGVTMVSEPLNLENLQFFWIYFMWVCVMRKYEFDVVGWFLSLVDDIKKFEFMNRFVKKF